MVIKRKSFSSIGSIAVALGVFASTAVPVFADKLNSTTKVTVTVNGGPRNISTSNSIALPDYSLTGSQGSTSV